MVIYLFLFFQALYGLTTSGNTFRVPDEFEVYFQAERFVDAGDLSVPQTFAMRQPVVVQGRVVRTDPIFFGKVGQDRKPYAPYGPLAALLTLPHHLAARAVAYVAGVPRMPLPDGIPWLFLVSGLTALATSTAGALAVAGFYRASMALGASSNRALTLSLLLGGATLLWPYSTTLYSEAFVAAAFIWAVALMLEARQSPDVSRPRLVAAAFLIFVAGMTKPTALVLAPALIVAPLVQPGLPSRQRLRTALLLAAGAALAAGFHAWWNMYRFGSPFDLGYDWSETVPVQPFRPFAIEDLPRGLSVLLFSPGKSILLWAPALLLALSRGRELWEAERAVAVGLMTAAGISLLFYGTYMFPEGGYSHGPRHLAPLVPLWLLAAANPSAAPPSRASIAACGLAGAVIALLAVSVSFLEDQAIGADLSSGYTSYYERIDPAPGRPSNRYNLEYVPFLRTLRSADWIGRNRVGVGPDYLPYNLEQVRRGIGGGEAIPYWLPRALPMPFVLLLVWSGLRLRRAT